MKAKISFGEEVLEDGRFSLSTKEIGGKTTEKYFSFSSVIARCVSKIGDKCYMLEREGFRRQENWDGPEKEEE